MKQSKAVWLAVTGLCAWLTVARAADDTLLDSVPADRDVVIVADVPRILSSQPFRALEQQGAFTQADVGLAELEHWTGFNLRRDLKQLVVAKFNGRDRDDIAFLEGTFDEAQILDALRLNPKYEDFTHQGVTIHSWFDDKEKRQKFGAFLAADLIVIGTEEGVKQVIEVRTQPAKSFASQPEVRRLLNGLSGNPVLWAVVPHPGNQPKKPKQNKIPALLLTVELEPSFAINLSAETADAAAARDLKVLANGLVALGRLSNVKSDAQIWTENASVQVQGKKVILGVNIPEEQFVNWLLEKAKLKRNNG